jgi:cytoskeleton protein RodZ
MKKTGQILKEAREAKSISLQEISIHLKINTKTLKALETGDKAQLPAKTFLRGFVQSYAQFLKLDLNQIMEVFQEEMGSTHPGMITTQLAQPPPNYQAGANPNQPAPNSMNAHFQSLPKSPTPESAPANSLRNSPPTKPLYLNKSNNQTHTNYTGADGGTASNQASGSAPKVQVSEPVPPSISFDPQTWSHSLKIGTAILVLVIVSVIIGIKKTIDKYEREATLPKQEGQTESSGKTDISTVTNSVSPPTSGTDAITPNSGLNISHEALTISSKPISNPEMSTIPETNTTGQMPSVITATGNSSITEGQASITSPQATPNVTATNDISPQEVIIEALDKVVVEYSIDGGPKNSIALLAEKIHTFKAQKNISLSFSDGGSVNLIHNGKDKGVPGNLGQPYVVSFPK